MIDSSTGEANTHMYWTGFTLITCKNSIAGPIVNTQSVVVLIIYMSGVVATGVASLSWGVVATRACTLDL